MSFGVFILMGSVIGLLGVAVGCWIYEHEEELENGIHELDQKRWKEFFVSANIQDRLENGWTDEEIEAVLDDEAIWEDINAENEHRLKQRGSYED